MLSQETSKIPRYYHGRCLKGLNMSTIVFYFSMIDGINRQAPQGCPREPPLSLQGCVLKPSALTIQTDFCGQVIRMGAYSVFFLCGDQRHVEHF